MINSLYLHIPYCKSRCIYCDFYTQAQNLKVADSDRYVQALTLALKRLWRTGLLAQLSTVYIGGGTPSYLQEQLVTLIAELGVMVDLKQLKEVSVECNPDSFNLELFKDLRALGVNRYSLGVQSFNEHELALLNRAHGLREIDEALSLLSREQQRISLDLICGLPQQSFESFTQSLHRALEYDIEHISIYPLSVEEHTPLAQMIAAGSLSYPDEDLQADMMRYAHEFLTGLGFDHYELGNYARCQAYAEHNLAYWQKKSYLGLGPHAASMMDVQDFKRFASCFGVSCPALDEDARVRLSFTDNTKDFIRKILNSDEMLVEGESLKAKESLGVDLDILSFEAALIEDMMLAMRTQWGINVSELEATLHSVSSLKSQAESLLSRIYELFDELCTLGFACYEQKQGCRYLRPCQESWLCANEMFSRIWDLALRV